MQQLGFVRAGVIGAVALAALLGAGGAQAALQDRDLDGNGATDAFYDTDLDITWLRDANVNGLMNLVSATNWVSNLSIGAYGDWRLPTTSVLGCYGYNNCSSEMGHLWYSELGNSPGALTNTGNFQNLLPSSYWTGTEYAGGIGADVFDQANGTHSWASNLAEVYAMAVRNGDVSAIPEPGTYALMLAGLVGLALRRGSTAREF